MSIVHTLLGARPPARSDGEPWNRVRIEHSESEDGPWIEDDTQGLSPLDSNPLKPAKRDLTFTSELAEAFFRLIFLDSKDQESTPTDPVYFTAPSASTSYAQPGDLRAKVGMSAEALPDTEAAQFISEAEDLIDERLGVRPVDPDSGRKVVPAEEDEWRIAKLRDATLEVAAVIFRDPDVAARQRARFTSGDVSVSGPYGAAFGERADALLNQSGLRVNRARMSGSVRRLRTRHFK
jgi:hypothetical protein